MATDFGRQSASGHLRVSAESKEPYAADVEARFREDAALVIARYPQKRSALLPLLHLVQSVDGYVSGRGIELCAELLDLETAEVSGVATFYTQYKRHPNGEYTVGVCTNTLCAIMGGDRIWDEVSNYLGIGHDETTADGKVTLERVECNAACDYAPVVMANWEFFDNQTPESTRQLVDDLRDGKPVRPSRGPSRVCTFKEVSRTLAGFPDGLADEGVGAGPASLVGLHLAHDRGWVAPGEQQDGATHEDGSPFAGDGNGSTATSPGSAPGASADAAAATGASSPASSKAPEADEPATPAAQRDEAAGETGGRPEATPAETSDGPEATPADTSGGPEATPAETTKHAGDEPAGHSAGDEDGPKTSDADKGGKSTATGGDESPEAPDVLPEHDVDQPAIDQAAVAGVEPPIIQAMDKSETGRPLPVPEPEPVLEPAQEGATGNADDPEGGNDGSGLIASVPVSSGAGDEPPVLPAFDEPGARSETPEAAGAASGSDATAGTDGSEAQPSTAAPGPQVSAESAGDPDDAPEEATVPRSRLNQGTDSPAVLSAPTSPAAPSGEDGPHGPGSAYPGPDGKGPQGWEVKGKTDARVFHTTDSPWYRRTKAEVWFRDAEAAVAAGFTDALERTRTDFDDKDGKGEP